MKNNENANVKDFTEAVENMAEDTNEAVEVQKKGLLEKFMALKTWQKIAVITLVTGTVAGGAFVIFKLINNKPEVVAEAIETVAQSTPEVVAEVVA